jgi:ABC-type branched-subunit amino acid transport system substrate-binding protein
MTNTRTTSHRLVRWRTVSLIAMLSITLAACGARLSPDQRAAAIAYGAQANAQGGAAGGSDGGTTSGGATGGSVTGGTTGGSATGGTTGGKSTTGGSSTGGTAGGKSATGGSSTSGTSGGTTGGSAGGTTGGTTGGATGGSTGGTGGGPGSDTCNGTATGSTAPGVTATTISIGNASDLSGPIGGLFASARDSVNAYVAYFNATHPNGICGRKLKVDGYDSQTSDTGDNQATIAACQNDFALVGSVSAYDSGGAQQAAQCGIPDLQAISLTRARQTCPVCFGTSSQQMPLVPRVNGQFWIDHFPDAVKKAAFLHVDTPITTGQAKSWEVAYAKLGFTWVLDQPIGISESNYAPYVQKLQQSGAQYVQFIGAYQQAANLAQTMQQQGYTPKVFVLDPTAYDPNFVQQAGSAADKAWVFSDGGMFEEAGSDPEMQLYIKWLHQVAPGQEPTFFGMFAWSSAELFVRLANQVGPNLTRQAMINAIQGVHGYTGNGMFAPQDVGGKKTSPCALFLQLQGNAWKRVSPASGYTCADLIDSGVNG